MKTIKWIFYILCFLFLIFILFRLSSEIISIYLIFPVFSFLVGEIKIEISIAFSFVFGLIITYVCFRRN